MQRQCVFVDVETVVDCSFVGLCVSSCVWLSVSVGVKYALNCLAASSDQVCKSVIPRLGLLRKGFQFHLGLHKSVQQRCNFVDVERVACPLVG